MTSLCPWLGGAPVLATVVCTDEELAVEVLVAKEVHALGAIDAPQVPHSLRNGPLPSTPPAPPAPATMCGGPHRQLAQAPRRPADFGDPQETARWSITKIQAVQRGRYE
jgi:hypothetical protein